MLRGVDISNWQSVGAGDNGADFVIIKATEGTNYVDPKCDQHYQRAKSQGKLLGVYHFGRPDKNGGTDGAKREAQYFVKNIQGYIKQAILVLDYEVAPYSDDWARAFMDEVYNLTGVYPMIYASASKINGFNWSKTAAVSGLWIAGYPAKYDVKNPPVPSVNDMPYKIGAWKFWCIWQYSSCAGTLDVDIANLDKTAWMKYANPSSQPAPAPTPAPSTGFLPAKGYWCRGDNDPRVGQLAAFMRQNFPAYTSSKALGNYYGQYLESAIKEFQRRAKADGRYDDAIDGDTGPKTYAALKSYGFTG